MDASNTIASFVTMVLCQIFCLAHDWPADAAGHEQKTPTHAEVANFTEGNSERLYGVDDPRFLRHSASMQYQNADKIGKDEEKSHSSKSNVLKSFQTPCLQTGAGPEKIDRSTPTRRIQVPPLGIHRSPKGFPSVAPKLLLNQRLDIQIHPKLLKTNK